MADLLLFLLNLFTILILIRDDLELCIVQIIEQLEHVDFDY